MISILIPVYNTNKQFIYDCINSCLEQTFQQFEIVIVDNGSDNIETIQALNYFSNLEKISVYRCERQAGKKNLSIALNFGIKKCKYNLVARMDSDDIMDEKRLEKQYKYFVENSEVDILGGQIYIPAWGSVTSHPNIITKQVAANSTWFINHPTVMFKKEKILSIAGYKEEPEHFAEDYDLWLKSLTAGLQIHNLQDIIVYYRVHENNLSKTTERSINLRDSLEQARLEFMIKNDLS